MFYFFLSPQRVLNAPQSRLILSPTTDPAGKCHPVTGTKPANHSCTLRGSAAVTSSQVRACALQWLIVSRKMPRFQWFYVCYPISTKSIVLNICLKKIIYDGSVGILETLLSHDTIFEEHIIPCKKGVDFLIWGLYFIDRKHEANISLPQHHLFGPVQTLRQSM